jgi:hypothetical protein
MVIFHSYVSLPEGSPKIDLFILISGYSSEWLEFLRDGILYVPQLTHIWAIFGLNAAWSASWKNSWGQSRPLSPWLRKKLQDGQGLEVVLDLWFDINRGAPQL